MISKIFRKSGLNKASNQLPTFVLYYYYLFVIININISLLIIVLLKFVKYILDISLVDLDYYMYKLGVYYRLKIMN